MKIISYDFLVVSLVLIGLFLLPGICLSILFFRKDEMNWLERMPVGFTLALSLLSVPILLVKSFSWGWDQFLWIWVTLIVVIVTLTMLYALARGWWRTSPAVPNVENRETSTPSSMCSAIKFSHILVLFFLTLVAAAWLTSFTPRDEDDWSYFAIVRALADSTSFPTFTLQDLRYGVNVWWFFHAFIVRISGVDVVQLGQDWMPFGLAPLSLLAFYALGVSLFSDRRMALFAAILQFFFYIADLFNRNTAVPWPGWWVLARIDQDHTAVIFIWLPVFSMLFVRYVQKGGWHWLFSMAIVQVGLVSSHAREGLTLSALTVGTFLFVYLLFVKRERWKQVAFALAPIIAFLVLLFPLIRYWFSFSHGQLAHIAASAGSDFPFTTATFLILSKSVYIVRPEFLAQPPVLAAVILTPFLIPFLSRNLAAQYLFGNIVGLLSVLYIPPIFAVVEDQVGYYGIFRLWNWMPVAYVITFFVPHVLRLWEQGLTALRNRVFDWRTLVSILVAVLVLYLPAQWNLSVPSNARELFGGGHGLPDGAPELLMALRQHSAKPVNFVFAWRDISDLNDRLSRMDPLRYIERDVVLAWRDITDAIPAYGVTLKPVLFRENPQAIERMDADTFYSAILLTSEHLEILEKYNVKYVVIRANQEIISQFDLMPNYFKPLYRGEYGSLYQVTLLSPNPLIEANTIAAYGNWDEAIRKYNEVITAGMDDSLAHTGLGIMLELLGKLRLAAREFEQALQCAPNNLQAHYHLAKIYRTLGMDEKAQAHAQAAGRLMENIK